MSEHNQNIENLLKTINLLVDENEKLKREKGENFNIFSVLNMESKENATHSAFLGELLDPRGSHMLGNLFLELFLNTIGHKQVVQFDLGSARLKLEKYIGKRDDTTKEGGRIDIYLYDKKGNTISIENKIYASDQPHQIERYANHNKKHNTVYYLTLKGDTPSEVSVGELENEKDYHCISYRSTILLWLTSCLKEATKQPLLSASIEQYMLLIKKLTNQLSNSKMDAKIYQLISDNYDAAKDIESNLWRVELEETKAFLKDLSIEIKENLGDGWSVEVGDITKVWTGLEIRHKSWGYPFVQFQGAPYMATTDSGYGIRASRDEWDRDLIDDKLSGIHELNESFGDTEAWPYFTKNMSMRTPEERARIFKSDERKVLIDAVSSELIELAKFCESKLAGLIRLNV